MYPLELEGDRVYIGQFPLITPSYIPSQSIDDSVAKYNILCDAEDMPECKIDLYHSFTEEFVEMEPSQPSEKI